MHHTPTQIQQQMYTRERRGIFRSTEGYDTIAVSRGLDASFVKKILHPFCVYDAPMELTTAGEKDNARYPDALHLFHTDQGAIVMGRSVYQSADFTGLRSTFFTHNYVIPAERSAEIISNYGGWMQAAFADSYDIEQGTELPELDQIPLKSEASFRSSLSVRERLAALKIDERIFKQLLFAFMMSAAGKRKVYIALDVPIEQLSVHARELLTILFASLPYAYRKLLGFMTFVKDLQSKRGIHIMFVEKGSFRPNDRNTEKEYTFDLASGRVMNIDAELPNQPYLDLAWSNLDQPERAERFYQFADQMLGDMDPVRQAAIASYHELCVYYLIEEGQEALYDMNKVAVLRGMLEYLHTPGAPSSKQRLNDLFVALLNREYDQIKQGQQLDPAAADCFKDYYRISGGKHEGQIIALFIHAISQAKADKDAARAAAIYAVARKHHAFSKVFFDTILNRGMAGALFDPYMKEQFDTADRAGDVIDLVCEWGSLHLQVLSSVSFSSMAQTALLEKLRPENDPVTVVNAILEQLRRLPRTRWEDAELADSALIENLAYAANVFLLTELDLESLTKEQLLQIGFLQQPDEVREWAARFGSDVQAKAAMMLAAYQWFSLRQPDMKMFDDLSDAEIEQVQKLGRKWLSREVVPSQFDRIVLAFYRDGDAGLVEYGALLHFLQSYAADREIVYQFMQWSESHTSFVRKRKPSPSYSAAIITYFKKHDKEAFKKRAYRKQYFEQAESALKPVYAKARMELASPLMRMLTRNQKAVFGLLAIVILAGGSFIGLQAAGVFDKEAPPVTVDNPGTTTSPPIVAEKPIVYAEQVSKIVEGKEQVVTQLVFGFKDGQACAEFKPETLTIVAPDGSKKVNDKLVIASACSVNRGKEADPVNGADAGTGTGTGTDAATNTNTNANANSGANADKAAGTGEGGADKTQPSGAGDSTDKGTESDASAPDSTDVKQDESPLLNLVTISLNEKYEMPIGTTIQIGTESYPLVDKPLNVQS